MPIHRRQLIRTGAQLAAAGAFGSIFGARRATATWVVPSDAPLAVPEGFEVVVLDRGADAPDGMGCFLRSDGLLALMRNHEVQRPLGGVSRLLVDPATLAVKSVDRILTGTERNCAGGLSPWGWLSCEEAFSDDCGYVYLCDPETGATQRIPSYGHFNHEAATVDPATLIAYLTEDRADSAFYRFVPRDLAAPFVGSLQAMASARFPELGETVDVTWVDLDDVDQDRDVLRAKAADRGACVFRRGEGLWQFQSRVYFTATSGGAAGRGQIFCHDVDAQTLRLVAESTDAAALDMPDNLTISPWGDVFIAEDGGGEQFIRLVSATGDVVPFAKNLASSSEIAGLCFSPDGETLFANLQWDGLTVAIRGPFREWCGGASFL